MAVSHVGSVPEATTVLRFWEGVQAGVQRVNAAQEVCGPQHVRQPSRQDSEGCGYGGDVACPVEPLHAASPPSSCPLERSGRTVAQPEGADSTTREPPPGPGRET